MKQIELTEDQVGLVKICLEIGRDRFQALAATSMAPRVCDQFARQGVQAEELLNFFREAEEIVLRFNDAAVPA
jgi:hypothetical protein